MNHTKTQNWTLKIVREELDESKIYDLAMEDHSYTCDLNELNDRYYDAIPGVHVKDYVDRPTKVLKKIESYSKAMGEDAPFAIYYGCGLMVSKMSHLRKCLSLKLRC